MWYYELVQGHIVEHSDGGVVYLVMIELSEMREVLLKEEEVSEMLKLSKQTLQSWRRRGEGPLYCKFRNRSVRYQVGDVLDWIEERKRTCTRG